MNESIASRQIMSQRNGISLVSAAYKTLLHRIFAVDVLYWLFLPPLLLLLLTVAAAAAAVPLPTRYQIVYVSKCWGEIVWKRKYVNETNSWNEHSVHVEFGSVCSQMAKWTSEWVNVRALVHIWFSVLSLKLAFPQPFVFYGCFQFFFSFPFGFKFDQGLFMAILLVKIARSSFLISCDLSRLMWITVFLVVWAIFKSAICVWDPDPQCANVVCACACVCFTESTAQVYPFKCGHSE